jgi:DNA-binding response OmpR family regulator
MMMSRRRILHFGYDTLLAEARSLILEDAGYEVVVADTRASVIRVLKTQRVSLVIACHSVPPRELAPVVREMRRTWPGVPIMVVHVGGTIQPQRSVADAFIDGLRGPEHLLTQVAAAIARSITTVAAS